MKKYIIFLFGLLFFTQIGYTQEVKPKEQNKISEEQLLKIKRIIEIRKRPSANSLAELQQYIKDDNSNIRSMAIRAIGRICKRLDMPEAVPVAANVYKEEKEKAVKENARKVLESMNAPSIFIEELKSEDSAVRISAAKSLSKINGDLSKNSLMKAFSAEEDKKAKREIAVALIKLKSAYVIPYLSEEMNNMALDLANSIIGNLKEFKKIYSEKKDVLKKYEESRDTGKIMQNINDGISKLETFEDKEAMSFSLSEFKSTISALYSKLYELRSKLHEQVKDENNKITNKCKDENAVKFIDEIIKEINKINQPIYEIENKGESILKEIAMMKTEEGVKAIISYITGRNKVFQGNAVEALSLCKKEAGFAASMLYEAMKTVSDKTKRDQLVQSIVLIGEKNSISGVYNYFRTDPELKKNFMGIVQIQTDTSNEAIGNIIADILDDNASKYGDFMDEMTGLTVWLYNHAVDMGKLPEKLEQPLLKLFLELSRDYKDVKRELLLILGRDIDEFKNDELYGENGIITKMSVEKQKTVGELLRKKSRIEMFRDHLTVCMAYVGTDESIKPILELIESADASSRIRGYDLLGYASSAGNRKATKELISALSRERDENVNIRISSFLTRSSEKEARSALMEAYKTSKNPGQKQTILRSLGYYGKNEEDIPILLEGLKDEDKKVRNDAVVGLVKNRAKTALKELANAFSSMSFKDRAEAFAFIRNRQMGQQYPSNNAFFAKVRNFVDALDSSDINEKRIALAELAFYGFASDMPEDENILMKEKIVDLVDSKDKGLALEAVLYITKYFWKFDDVSDLRDIINERIFEVLKTAREEEKELTIEDEKKYMEYYLCKSLLMHMGTRNPETIELAKSIYEDTERKGIKDWLDKSILKINK